MIYFLLLLGNLYAPLFLRHEACNSLVTLARIKICKDEENGGISCVCLFVSGVFPSGGRTTHIFDPFNLYPSLVFSARVFNA